MDASAQEVTLDRRVVDSQLTQVQRHEPGLSPEPHALVGLRLGVHPGAVLLLERNRESDQMPRQDSREPLHDFEPFRCRTPSQSEADAAGKRAPQRGVSAGRSTEPEAACRLVEVELEAVGFVVEPVGQPAEQPDR